MTGREELRPVASLIKLRNRVDREIAATIGRPAHPGHMGRFVAAAIFDIRLYKSATHRGLAGPVHQPATRWHIGEHQEVTQLTRGVGRPAGRTPDFFLVLTGARAAPASSRRISPGSPRVPFVFES